MTQRPDPFTDAVCRQPNRLVRWWDADARDDERNLAAQLCRTCPVTAACADLAAALGDGASGTYAGQFIPWTGPTVIDDEAMHEFLSVFGPSAATSDNPMPTQQPAKPFKYGRYWIHPAQLHIEYQEAN